MTEQTHDLLDREIAARAHELRFLASQYLNEGTPASVLCAAMMKVVGDLMQAQGMSRMLASNELYRLVDGVREAAFTDSEKND